MTATYWQAWARREARKQLRLVVRVTALAIVGLSLLGWFGCGTQVTNTPTGREVVFAEVKGGAIAGLISNVWGADIDAITLPTNPPTTIILRDSDDPGLICHERRHREQVIELGALEFKKQYLSGLLHHGYWNNPMEVDARRVQDECNGGGP